MTENKKRKNHPIYKINKKKIMLKATAFALSLVSGVIWIAYIILEVF